MRETAQETAQQTSGCRGWRAPAASARFSFDQPNGTASSTVTCTARFGAW
ncbi:hypothetical protein ACFFRL_13205 [Agromyces hippuratus]